jgi:hypothetical protein
MNKIIFFAKLSLDALRDTIKIIKYFNLLKRNSLLVIPKIFLIRFLYSFQAIRNLQKISLKKKEEFKFNFIDNGFINLNEVVKDLDTDGYSKIFIIKKDILDKIRELAFLSKNIDIKKNNFDKTQLIKKSHENLDDYFKRIKLLDVSRFTSTLNLNEDSVLKDFLLSEPILSIAKSYLDTRDLSINATFFVSNPLKIDESEKYKNAQYFHWDNDFSKFFKLYIYLTDVDENSGPHVYITGTHKQKFPEHSLCRLYSDESIYNKYKIPKKFIGQAGSMFLVDSYGLHKGETPTEKSRLMLNIHYGRGKILYSADDIYIKNSA